MSNKLLKQEKKVISHEVDCINDTMWTVYKQR